MQPGAELAAMVRRHVPAHRGLARHGRARLVVPGRDGDGRQARCRGHAHRPERASAGRPGLRPCQRSEEHTSELQSLMRISYAVFCLKKKTTKQPTETILHSNTQN